MKIYKITSLKDSSFNMGVDGQFKTLYVRARNEEEARVWVLFEKQMSTIQEQLPIRYFERMFDSEHARCTELQPQEIVDLELETNGDMKIIRKEK